MQQKLFLWKRIKIDARTDFIHIIKSTWPNDIVTDNFMAVEIVIHKSLYYSKATQGFWLPFPAPNPDRHVDVQVEAVLGHHPHGAAPGAGSLGPRGVQLPRPAQHGLSL